MDRVDATIADLTNIALRSFLAADSANFSERNRDGGPAILAGLADAAALAGSEQLLGRTLACWLTHFEEPPTHPALFGGLAGMLTGIDAGARLDPRLQPLANQLRATLETQVGQGVWQVPARDWMDYDLVTGASGVALALAAESEGSVRGVVKAGRHLAAVPLDPSLSGLRITACASDQQRSWNYQRINSGVAHGVGGIVAALSIAVRLSSHLPERTAFEGTLRHLCAWLSGEAYEDSRGLITWTPAGRENTTPPSGASRRQAWCYGTPGLAWVLWEAGRVLEDTALQCLACDAMYSYCRTFDETFYLDDTIDEALAICHGAAGILLIADAFARDGRVDACVELGDRLEEWLLEHSEDINAVAERNMTLLSGASGILAALLTRHGGDRRWLIPLGLR